MPSTPLLLPFILSSFLPLTFEIGKNEALPKLFLRKCSINLFASCSLSVTIFCMLAPSAISIAVSIFSGTSISSAIAPLTPFPSSFTFSQSFNKVFTLLWNPSFSFSVSTKNLYFDSLKLSSWILLFSLISIDFILSLIILFFSLNFSNSFSFSFFCFWTS